ncbi:hypothetical protein TNCV_3976191 [Trichonephila clavipes]|nr:hypothetical protein TNCV_3976191 [Trichonephila clavipes]
MSGGYLTLKPQWHIPQPKDQPCHCYRVQCGRGSIRNISRPAVKALSEYKEIIEIGNVIEEVVCLISEINLEVDSDDVQELLDSHYQKLTIDELIEMSVHEQDIEELDL